MSAESVPSQPAKFQEFHVRPESHLPPRRAVDLEEGSSEGEADSKHAERVAETNANHLTLVSPTTSVSHYVVLGERLNLEPDALRTLVDTVSHQRSGSSNNHNAHPQTHNRLQMQMQMQDNGGVIHEAHEMPVLNRSILRASSRGNSSNTPAPSIKIHSPTTQDPIHNERQSQRDWTRREPRTRPHFYDHSASREDDEEDDNISVDTLPTVRQGHSGTSSRPYPQPRIAGSANAH